VKGSVLCRWFIGAAQLASQRGGQHCIVMLQLFVLRFNCKRPLVVLFGLVELRKTDSVGVKSQGSSIVHDNSSNRRKATSHILMRNK
jgi:hypothetical protein